MHRSTDIQRIISVKNIVRIGCCENTTFCLDDKKRLKAIGEGFEIYDKYSEFKIKTLKAEKFIWPI